MSEQPTTTQPNQLKPQKRDPLTGLVEGVNYIYTEEGLVDWRAMIKPEFLVVNKQAFERKGKPVPESVEGLKDNEVLILLAGIKNLAQLRGFDYVSYKVESPSPDYVVAVCTVSWIGNYETEGREVGFSAIGDASLKNTSGFGSNYLGPIAENRAFVRAVRNFLKINILGQDEVGPSVNEAPPENSTSNLLATTMKDNGIEFAQLKAKLIEEKVEGAEKFESVNDIPKHLQFTLVGRIKKKAAEKA